MNALTLSNTISLDNQDESNRFKTKIEKRFEEENERYNTTRNNFPEENNAQFIYPFPVGSYLEYNEMWKL